MVTIIKIGDIGIEVAKNKVDLLFILRNFLKDNVIAKGTHDKSLGMFNGLSQLSSKLIQHLENLGEEEKYPSTVWVVNPDKVDYDYEEKILITQGKSNALTKDEIKKVKSGVFDFDVYGRIHETYQINIDGKSTISNLANFKKLMEKRFKDYNNMQM